MPTYYSQQGEDEFVYQHYLRTFDSNGIFVEVGASDGVEFSNTKFFEDELGFSGLLIEGAPFYYKSLIQNRPHCKCIHAAISNTEGTADFLYHSHLSGLPNHLHRSNVLCPDTKIKREFTKFSVPMRRLDIILRENAVPYIDYLSIDVEGGELEVLESMDWSIPVKVIVIELWCSPGHPNEAVRNDLCRDILKSHKFILDRQLGLNDIWLNPSYSRTQSA